MSYNKCSTSELYWLDAFTHFLVWKVCLNTSCVETLCFCWSICLFHMCFVDHLNCNYQDLFSCYGSMVLFLSTRSWHVHYVVFVGVFQFTQSRDCCVGFVFMFVFTLWQHIHVFHCKNINACCGVRVVVYRKLFKTHRPCLCVFVFAYVFYSIG